ncbi:MAG TPA: nucleoside hydrolase [Pirellulaceae bacterium]|nr:nucleoside hydrolase [Pirellulaceae bacterium]
MPASSLSRELLVVIFIGLAATALADESQSPKTPVLLDCAMGNGTDDALALALAASDPTIELLGVTTVSGNTEDRAWMVCRFLSAIGKGNIPVAYGRGNQPPAKIGAQFQYRYHPAVLYGRTAKPVKQTAVELLQEKLSGSKGKTTIVCTGPLTNIAQLLAEHPDAKERIAQIVVSEGNRNLGYDAPSAKRVLESGISMVVVQHDVGLALQLGEDQRRQIFGRTTPLTMQLQTLYELDSGDGFYPDIAALALASQDPSLDKAMATMPAIVTVTASREAQWVEGASPVRVVKSLKAEPIVEWVQKHLVAGEPALPRELANRTKPIDRGGMPNRVHVFEDYETQIERRWWLAGIADRDAYRRDLNRYCRGMLTMDFDDQQGDTKTMYRAVIFNPVPGPPMGKMPRLSFRCWLKGTDQLRVQIYSLSNGYHRYLSLTDLPQGKWLDLAVDMKAARRHDGSGGPLSENERIDDIQFYVDPRAELSIDDIILYDAAAPGEDRPFPQRLQFTGWFDTGKQGQEWPGDFEIPADSGFFWKAARTIQKEGGRPEIRVLLRGSRPLGKSVQVDFRYKAAAGGTLDVVLRDTKSRRELRASVTELKAGDWQQASLTLSRPAAEKQAGLQDLAAADELHFILAGDGPLLVDDVLVYEPAP